MKGNSFKNLLVYISSIVVMATSCSKIITCWVIVMFVRLATFSFKSSRSVIRRKRRCRLNKNLYFDYNMKSTYIHFKLNITITWRQCCCSRSCCRRCWPTIIIANRRTPTYNSRAILSILISTRRRFIFI